MKDKFIKKCCIVFGLVMVAVFWWLQENMIKENENASVVINEICSNNFSTAPIEDYEDADWIELYNATSEVIDITGWTITDKVEKREKYIFNNTMINPGEHLVIAAEESQGDEKGRIFLNFSLSEGEKIYLYDEKGKLVDSVVIPAMKQNTSYARNIDAGNDWVNVIPTPEISNDNAEWVQNVMVDEPRFSIESGFYDGEQSLTLSAPNGLRIYYTLDGSEPTQNGLLYTEPIIIRDRSEEDNVLAARSDLSTQYSYRYAPEEKVDKIAVVRAIAIDEMGNESEVVSHSYMIDIHDKECYKDLVTVSINTNADDFFDFSSGLYVVGEDFFIYKDYKETWEGDPPTPNYKQSGISSERPANIIIMDSNGSTILNQNIGIRIRGNATRVLSQKSFSLFARELYGEKNFEADVFGNNYQYDKMLLFSDRDFTKIRHELHNELLQGREVGLQKFERCNVFLNGEYWGLYSLAEAYSEEYIENYYGVPRDEVIIESVVIPSELEKYAYNKENLSTEELYEGLLQKIDIDSFIDYFAANIYIDNYDWLVHNGYCWKSTTVSKDNPYQDGKWRWMMYDTELCETGYDVNTFEVGFLMTWETNPIVEILMTSDEFRQKFAERFMDMANTCFEKEHVAQTIDSIWSSYSNAVDAQAMRWGDDWADEVYSELEHIRTFYNNRYEYIVPYMEEQLDYRVIE